MSDCLDVARAAWLSGVSVLPAEPGEKIPAKHLGKWRRFQDYKPTVGDWLRWKFSTQAIGIVCGGALCIEAIDFDLAGAAYADWAAVVDADVLARCYVERSPSGGLHIIYRCAAKPDGNVKLCDWYFEVSGTQVQSHKRGSATINTLLHYDGNEQPMVTFGESAKQYKPKKIGDKLIAAACPIETRGEGGWLIVAPSPGYVVVQGSLAELPQLTADERDGLLRAARNMSDAKVVAPLPVGRAPVAAAQAERPGDRYMREGSHAELLERHGWTFQKLVGDNEHWCRPGKARGTSATWEVNLRVLYVLSTSTELETHSPYSLFALLAALEHDGSHWDAARALANEYRGAAAQIATSVSGGAGDHETPKMRGIIDTAQGRSVVDKTGIITGTDELLAEQELLAAKSHIDAFWGNTEAPPEEAPPATTSEALPAAGSEEPVVYELNDFGNASRLFDVRGTDVRFCHTWQTWLTWQGTHWEEDNLKITERWSREAMVSTCDDAITYLVKTKPNIGGDPNRYEKAMLTRHEKMIDAHRKWRVKVQNRRTYENACAVATTIEKLSLVDDDLDKDQNLFAVRNGCIDLRSGELRTAKREDLMTCVCDVDYDSNAMKDDNPGARRWLKFLDEFTQSDAVLAGFLQRWAGYCMTGSTKEQKFAFFQGPGGSGKSTFISTIQSIIGSYAETADFDLFLKSNNQNSRFAMSPFQKSRLLVCEEVADGRDFSGDVIKKLTGGSKIPAERKYSQAFSFYPIFKLNLVANDLPRVSDTDSGFWRRIILILCQSVVKTVDKDLMHDLANDPACQQAVLKWMIDGAVQWYADGLQIPESVQMASQGYRDQQDPLAAFLDDCTRWSHDGQNFMTPRRLLTARYKEYCSVNTTSKPLGSRALADRLRARGVGDCNMRFEGRSERAWEGFRLTLENETTDPNTPPLSATHKSTEKCADEARPALPEPVGVQQSLLGGDENGQNDENAAHIDANSTHTAHIDDDQVRPPISVRGDDLGDGGAEAQQGPHGRAISSSSFSFPQRDRDSLCADVPPPLDDPPPEECDPLSGFADDPEF